MTIGILASQTHTMPNPPFRDPWAKRDAWRKHPVFSNRAMFANLFPGLGTAIVAFSAYVLVDNLYLSKRKAEISHH